MTAETIAELARPKMTQHEGMQAKATLMAKWLRGLAKQEAAEARFGHGDAEVGEDFAEAAVLIDALPSLLEAAIPRSIDSAPRDGTHIQVINVNDPNTIPATVHWWAETEIWALSVNRLAQDCEYVWGPPTHWWPLPALSAIRKAANPTSSDK